MGRPRRVNCRRCGRHIDECGPLSARGLCERDGIAGVEQAVTAMYRGSGPIYVKWAANTAAGVERAARRALEREPEPEP